MTFQEFQGDPESQVTLGAANAAIAPEKVKIPQQSRADEDAGASNPQPMSNWRWFSICFGFCLGAMLYGMITFLVWYEINPYSSNLLT